MITEPLLCSARIYKELSYSVKDKLNVLVQWKYKMEGRSGAVLRIN